MADYKRKRATKKTTRKPAKAKAKAPGLAPVSEKSKFLPAVVTADDLKYAGACERQRVLFDNVFPSEDGMRWTAANIAKAAMKGLQVWWWIERKGEGRWVYNDAQEEKFVKVPGYSQLERDLIRVRKTLWGREKPHYRGALVPLHSSVPRHARGMARVIARFVKPAVRRTAKTAHERGSQQARAL